MTKNVTVNAVLAASEATSTSSYEISVDIDEESAVEFEKETTLSNRLDCLQAIIHGYAIARKLAMGPPMPQARLRCESSILYGNAVDYSHSCNKNRSISNNSYLHDSDSTSSREYLTP